MNDRELARLVADYKRRSYARLECSDSHLRRARSLAQAVELAAMATGADGKMLSHQRRIGAVTLRRWSIRLKRRLKEIRACRNFDDLHDLLWRLRLPGVGELAVYDAAVRLGAYLGHKPRRVYLHAGTRVGARNLGLLAPGKVGASTRRRTLAMRDLPAPLRRLAPNHVENFLCIYKKHFHKRTARAAIACIPPTPEEPNCHGRRGGA